VSLQRRSSMQVRFNSIEPRTGEDVVSRLRAWDGSVEEIERGILLRELEAQMTPEEAWIFDQKALGFSSEEIARLRGSSVNSVDKAMSRLKQKIHALIGVKE
jgi:DNA-directed RNA polymerase specialized sigma24 family protein